ncbi:hypothetical protein [uncultured Draconibacterium sp.]|uniref:hypothetical protein n=1 Tax=uncultured Draconibacterium sp. TaxID=1573823 RepID=UPI0032175630
MKIIYLVFFSFLLSVGLLAQENDSADQNSLLEPITETVDQGSVFDTDEPLIVTLKYDISSFVKHKSKGEYIDAELFLHLSDSDSIVKNIRLKARGNFRRGHCFFPPIYLNFKTDPIENTELKGIRKIKMVTHCESTKAYENYILREYLAYKLYNVFSEKSFKVRLVDINYIDTGKRGRNYHKYGFLIEPVELLAKRTGSIEVKPTVIKPEEMDDATMDVVALFEYMIANTDWRAKAGHNLKYLKSLTNFNEKVIPVPYDFDYSGFVDTHYAEPQEWVSIKSVSDREYLGYCRNSDEEYLDAIELFNQKEAEIKSVIANFTYLSERERNSREKFVDEFFIQNKRTKGMVSLLKNQCRSNEF